MGKRICILSNLSGTPVWNPKVVARQQNLIKKPIKVKPHIKPLEFKLGEWYKYEIKSGRNSNIYIVTLIKTDTEVFSECTCTGGSEVGLICYHVIVTLPYHRSIVLKRRKAKQKEWDDRPDITGTVTMQNDNFIVKIHNPWHFVQERMRALPYRIYSESENLYDVPSDKDSIE